MHLEVSCFFFVYIPYLILSLAMALNLYKPLSVIRFPGVVNMELDRLGRILLRRDSASEVWGSGMLSDANLASRRVIWHPLQVTIHPASVFSTRRNRPLRIQILQAGHFVLHRLNSLGHFGPIKSLVVK